MRPATPATRLPRRWKYFEAGEIRCLNCGVLMRRCNLMGGHALLACDNKLPPRVPGENRRPCGCHMHAIVFEGMVRVTELSREDYDELLQLVDEKSAEQGYRHQLRAIEVFRKVGLIAERVA